MNFRAASSVNNKLPFQILDVFSNKICTWLLQYVVKRKCDLLLSIFYFGW